MDTIRQQVSVDIPVMDYGYLKSIGQEKGWKIHIITFGKSDQKSKKSILAKLKGSITLPDNLDYKETIADAVLEKYNSI